MTLVIQPIGAAAMSRMPDALPSLACWPAVYGLVFLLRSLGFAFNFAAMDHLSAREPQRGLEQAEALIALATEHGFPRYLGFGTFFHAWALVDLGQMQEGLERMRAVVDATRAVGMRMGVLVQLGLLAQACGRAGLAGQGLAAVDEALELVEQTGEGRQLAMLHATRGDLLLAVSEGREGEAETSFRQALEVACSQEAKSYELVAATRLARLWHRQGKRKEARELLQPVYDWFTEGFDTRALKEAKALLDELA